MLKTGNKSFGAWLRKGMTRSVLFTCLFLTACALPRANKDPDITYPISKPSIPEKILVRDNTDHILNLPLSNEMLVPVPLESSEPLPDIEISNFSALDATAVEAFRLLLLDKKIAISADESAGQVQVNITNYSGKLQDIAERLSETAGVFYTYKNGLVRLSRDRIFIVQLPPVFNNNSVESVTQDGAIDSMTGLITSLGAGDVKIDKPNRFVTFRATRKVFDSVAYYLESLRKQKVMIVYETFFLEVTLNDSKSTGINWNQITKPGSSSGTTTSTINSLVDNSSLSFDNGLGGGTPALNIVNSGVGMAFGALFTSGSLNLNVLFDFLSQQGNVETLSKPVITMMSGGKSKFEVGRKIRFVSRRGVATTEGVSTTQATFETEDLATGLKVELSGDYSDDSVFTTINLSVDDLIRFTDPAPGTANSIQLPETATRSLTTNVRVRPGDSIMIAGINQTRDSRANAGPFTIGDMIPFLRSREEVVDRSELVIILRPRIVGFMRTEAEMDQAHLYKGDKTEPANLPAAAVPVEQVLSAPLTPPDFGKTPYANAPLQPALALTDPNINSHYIFRPNGSAEHQSQSMPQSAPSQPMPQQNTRPSDAWVSSYPPASMPSYPQSTPLYYGDSGTMDNRPQEMTPQPIVPPQSSSPEVYYDNRMSVPSDFVTEGDSYNRNRSRLPQAPAMSVPPSSAPVYDQSDVMTLPPGAPAYQGSGSALPPPPPTQPPAQNGGGANNDPYADRFGYYGKGQ